MPHDTDPSDQLAAMMPALLRAARQMTRSKSAAEDLVQEAALRVWTRLSKGATIDALRPYILATMRNIVRRRGTDVLASALDDRMIPGVASEASGRLAAADVLVAIDKLPPAQIRVLKALIQHEESYAELAKRLDLPVGTVMSRLSRARAALRLRLDLTDSAAIETLLDGLT